MDAVTGICVGFGAVGVVVVIMIGIFSTFLFGWLFC